MTVMLKAGWMWALLGGSGIAQATPPSNSGVQIVNYTLVIDPDAADRLQIRLPESVEYEEDISINHGTRSPSSFVFQVYTADPDSNTGGTTIRGLFWPRL
jgi:hypothetical protein